MSELSEGDQAIRDALAPFGWTCGPEFWQRYHTDAWVFNLANAVVRLSAALDEAQLRSIEARNPGIDMEDVRRIRAALPRASPLRRGVTGRRPPNPGHSEW